MTDLKDLDSIGAAEMGAEMSLRHPVTKEVLLQADKKTPIKIKLAGTDSERWRSAQRKRTNARLKSRQRSLTAEELESEGLELLVECTLGWQGMVYSGTPLECTPSNVRMVYQERPWVREQVDEFMGDRANFMKV